MSYTPRLVKYASRHPWTRASLPLIVIVAVWWLFFWRLFTPVAADRVQLASGDFTLQFLTFRRFGLSELQQGRWPLWMPCIDSGYPYFADPQAASFYPPALINYAGHLIGGASEFSLEALQLEAALHVLLAALLTYLFLCGVVRSRVAALIGSLVFAFGGYLTGYPMLQLAILESAAWLPLAMWAARRLAVRNDGRSIALLALPLTLSLLAGHPQTFMFSAYATTFYTLYRAWREGQRWRTTLIGLGGALGLTLLLSAVQLLPSLEFMRFSTRTEMSYELAGTGFPPSDIVQLIVSGVISHFNALYVGILPLVLVIMALGAWAVREKRRRTEIVFWLAVALLALLISFGNGLPLFDGLYWFAPGYRLFRDQERHAVLFSWAMAVLTAYGAAVLLHSLSRLMRTWLQHTACWLLALLIGLSSLLMFLVYLSSLGVDRAWADRLALTSIGLAVTIGLITLRARDLIRPRLLAAVLVVIVVLDVAAANRAVNWVKPYDPFPPLPSLEVIRDDARNIGLFRLHNEQRLPGHAACVNGLNEVGGITPIHVGAYQGFIKQVPREVRWRLLNVRYVVTWRSVLDGHLGQPIAATLLDQQGEGKDAIYTYRLAEEHPRAWIMHEVQVQSDRAAIYTALAAPDFNPRRVAYVQTPIEVAENQAIEPVSVTRFDPDRVELSVEVVTAGLLVLSEVNYPGWIARVNGVEAPVVEVNGALRGVALPTGRLFIEMFFQPRSLILGLLISSAGWGVWLVLLVFGNRQRKVGLR
ncbi:hypothetical protein TFLX_03566 [Thermoflexales bacterium]|nr:hypothetical protein TFLX_03566 [Thermoflexales bacterium]